MIVKEDFEKINNEVRNTVLELFSHIRQKDQKNEYYLFLANAQKVKINNQSVNPFMVDCRIDDYNDEARSNTLIDYANHHYSFKNIEITHDTLDSITFEMMIYTHLWESKPFLKILKRIANLVDGVEYDWDIKIPDFTKHEFIRKKICDKFKGLSFYNVFKSSYHSQIRNAFAHSDYALEPDAPKIELLNYEGKSHELEYISFDDWTKRFCYTFLIGFHIHNKFQEERRSLKSGYANVYLKDENGNNKPGKLQYYPDGNHFRGYIYK